MRTVDDHAEPVHLADHGPAERCQADVLVVAATSGKIVPVVGDEHLANAQMMVHLDHVQRSVEGIHPFKIKTHREIARLPCRTDSVDRGDELIAVAGENPAPEGRQRLDRITPVHDIVADIDAEIVNAGFLPDPQFAQIDTGVGTKTCVIIPDDGITKEPFRRLSRIVRHGAFLLVGISLSS